MTNRKRIMNTILCRKTDRPPFFYRCGPWEVTFKRWRAEGLEPDRAWEEECHFDPGFVTIEVNLGYYPKYKEEILEDKGETIICRDDRGILMETRKDGNSIPRFLDYPVKTVEDWEGLKAERLNPCDPGRFPGNWEALVRQYNEGDRAVKLGYFPYGLFGTCRDIMGVEEFLVAFYEQPGLIHDMMDTLTDLWLAIYEKVCKDVKVDCIHLWEDMSGKQGSLISPGMVREFMMPNYKRIKEFADKHGIPGFSVDTDGECSELVPLFMECGVNWVLPFEVAAGCDINEYRRKYPDLCIEGGIDKQEIAKGKEGIDRELKRIEGMFKSSGYIATLDHLIPPDISWADFKYFIKCLKQMIGISEYK